MYTCNDKKRKNFRFMQKNSTYRDCRGRRRNKEHHDVRRSPHVARQAANSILYEDTIYLKHFFSSLEKKLLQHNYDKLSFSVIPFAIRFFTTLINIHICKTDGYVKTGYRAYFYTFGKGIKNLMLEKNRSINLHSQPTPLTRFKCIIAKKILPTQ